MGSIQPMKQGNRTYYVYRESYRVKIHDEDNGKARGSGRSKVCSRAVYLGSAEKIVERLKQIREPFSLTARNFGVVAAAYQASGDIGLREILAKNIQGQRGKIDRWKYFLVTIINRLDHATSKNKMRQWLDKTILPELLEVESHRFSGQNFWYASDDVHSEKVLRQKRQARTLGEDPFEGLHEDVFNQIENELFMRIDELMRLSPSMVCYDTTNFYTYIEEPKRSELAMTCHSKDGKDQLRHIGLLMAVEKTHGIPLLSRVYKANRHDSKIFSAVLSNLLCCLKELCDSESELVLILDKGNNTKDNFVAMAGKISWVGSLVPSQHEDLLDLDLSRYHGIWDGYRYYHCTRQIQGIDCAVVLTFNPATQRRQEHSLQRGMNKLKEDLLAKWAAYKKTHKAPPRGILSMLANSRYGACFTVSVEDGQLQIHEVDREIEKRQSRFGKSLIFSNMKTADPSFLMQTYNQKTIIESDFQLLKEQTIIRFRPIRHWTDSKIRAFAFCCVVAMSLMRVMQWMVQQPGYAMSPQVLKEELSDIKEVVMIYSPKQARRKITDLGLNRFAVVLIPTLIAI